MGKIITLIAMIQMAFIGSLSAQSTAIIIINNSNHPVLYGSGSSLPTLGPVHPNKVQLLSEENSPFNFCYAGKNEQGNFICNPNMVGYYISSCPYTGLPEITTVRS